MWLAERLTNLWFIMLHKARLTGSPKNIFDMYLFDETPQRQTRLADLNLVKSRMTNSPRSELSKSSFKWRSIHFYNLMPLDVRCLEDTKRFKEKAKLWIKEILHQPRKLQCLNVDQYFIFNIVLFFTCENSYKLVTYRERK